VRGIELFAGAGGLGIGVSRAGFHPDLIVEWDRWCCDTLRDNRSRPWPANAAWPEPVQGDVRQVDFRRFEGIDLVTGGSPCQPFSLGGKHRAHDDTRDMWPEAVRAIRETRPRAFVFENVKGLTRSAFATYLGYVVLQLQHPSIAKKPGEDWRGHLGRLQRHHTKGGKIEYRVIYELLDAADYPTTPP
jgi:DNA (cytosine-5)-methyltransferase 1